MNNDDLVKERMKQIQEKQKQHQTISVDLSELKDHVCPRCGNVIFLRSCIFKKLPLLQRPEPHVKAYPMEIFVCSRCGRAMDVTDLDDEDEPKEEPLVTLT